MIEGVLAEKPFSGPVEVWAFIYEIEGSERVLWICDSRETAEAFARHWVEKSWKRLGRVGAPPEGIDDAFRNLADSGWYGEIERHRVATSADFETNTANE